MLQLKVKPMIETYKRLRFKATTAGILDGFQINYQTLPDIIVVEWLKKLEDSYTSPPNLYFDITNEATAMFGQLLVRGVQPFLRNNRSKPQGLDCCEYWNRG